MNYTELLKIPEQYDTIEKKLQWLEEESLKEQKRDRMEQDYSFQLYHLHILFYLLVIVLGAVSLYLFVGLTSYAILQSIEDIKRKRREKKHGRKS